MVYLSGTLYHSAPQAAVNLTIRHGGTVIIMERFDPEYLALIERYGVTHSQLVQPCSAVCQVAGNPASCI